jgi:cytochrome P450
MSRSSPTRGLYAARNPNPHGFRGGGAHFCLGANLARREISVTFEELRRRIPDIVASEEPTRLASSFIHAIKQLPVADADG